MKLQSKLSDHTPDVDYTDEEKAKTKKLLDDLKGCEEIWENIFMAFGQQVWNVPFKTPKLDVKKEWKSLEPILVAVGVLNFYY